MQKQKTIAKWLAILLLTSVAVGSYVLYDALYLNANNNQATANNGSENSQTDEQAEIKNEHTPYYTILPRNSENIDGFSVTHFGGESDDVLHGTVGFSDKQFAVFTSDSTEFDMREKGLSVALIDEGVEKVTHLSKTGIFVDGKMSSVGATILTQSHNSSTLFLLNSNGDIKAQVELPIFTDAKLFLGNKNLYLFVISDGFLKCYKIMDNMTVSQSPFVIETNCDNILEIFDSEDGQALICGDSASTSIYAFNQNKGFTQTFSQYKLSFKQIITAGTKTDCNYIIYGTLKGKPWLYSIDTTFNTVASKPIEGINDGVILPYAEGFLFVCNNMTKSYCKHLDEALSAPNSLTFECVRNFAYGHNGVFAIVENDESKCLMFTDGEIALFKTLDFKGDIVGIVSNQNGVSLLINSSSNQGVFRANFGKTDCFIIDISLAQFTSV